MEFSKTTNEMRLTSETQSDKTKNEVDVRKNPARDAIPIIITQPLVQVPEKGKQEGDYVVVADKNAKGGEENPCSQISNLWWRPANVFQLFPPAERSTSNTSNRLSKGF